MAKIRKNNHFKDYPQGQLTFFPERIDRDIDENDPVRVVNALIDGLDLRDLYKLYYKRGASPYHPKMMLKAVIYAYMCNVFSCRKIETRLKRDLHFIWLAGHNTPDYDTINRFRNRVKEEINKIFTQLVVLLAIEGYVTLDVEYIDGTKIESKANKYTFVWKKTVVKNREKLLKKIQVLLEQIDEQIAQENAAQDEGVELTPVKVKELQAKLSEALSSKEDSDSNEGNGDRKEKEKKIRELGKHVEKLAEYDKSLEILGDRNSYSKTDHDAIFMRMKEDAMNNGQTKPGYNLQIGTENQFITDFGLFQSPGDPLTMIPFYQSFNDRYGHFPGEGVADSGYGSEENYSFMEANEITSYVKYNMFHKEQKPRFRPNMFSAENLYYNEKDDYYVCPMGQHMTFMGERSHVSPSGYRSVTRAYRAQNCSGCPLRGQCYQSTEDRRTMEANRKLMGQRKRARELLTSEQGLEHRSKRPIEPEAVFGQIKYDMGYKRFRHFGLDKVEMDFAFLAIAFNIKKMCSKRAKSNQKQEKRA